MTCPDNSICVSIGNDANPLQLQIQAAAEQKLCLWCITDDIESGGNRRFGHGRKVDPGGDVLDTGENEWVIVRMVAEVTTQPAAAALGCIDLAP